MKIRQSSRQLVVKVLWHTAVSDRSIVFAAWRQSELPSNTGMPGIRASLFSKCSSIDRSRRFCRAHWCVYQECTQRQTTERARSLAIGRICSMYAMRCGLKTTAMIFNEQVYRVGQKSKLLILTEYVNKTEDRRNVNKYERLQIKWSIV